MRRHLTRIALIALSVTAIATDPPSAHANTLDQTMGAIAAHQQMGWKDNNTDPAILEQRIAQGGRVTAACGVIARVGMLAAQRRGLPVRLVAVLTNSELDGYNDGHTMFEVKVDGRWVLYDLDLNRVAVDNHGRRVGLSFQVHAGSHRRWKVIAHDSLRWNYAGTTAKLRRMAAPYGRMTPAQWYQHVMGTALIYRESTETWLFHNPAQASHVQAASASYHEVSETRFRALY